MVAMMIAMGMGMVMDDMRCCRCRPCQKCVTKTQSFVQCDRCCSSVSDSDLRRQFRGVLVKWAHPVMFHIGGMVPITKSLDSIQHPRMPLSDDHARYQTQLCTGWLVGSRHSRRRVIIISYSALPGSTMSARLLTRLVEHPSVGNVCPPLVSLPHLLPE